VNEKLAQKLSSFATVNEKTIRRILVKDFAWQEPANTGEWSEQDWYNVYASALIARQRDVSVSSTNDGKSSTARGTKIGTDAPAPSKSGKDPAKGPSKAESVQKKSGGVLPMVVSFTVYLTLVVVAIAALLWCTSSGQKLIAATVNSSKPALTFAEKLLPTLLESLKELSTWIARLPVGGQGHVKPKKGDASSRSDGVVPSQEL